MKKIYIIIVIVIFVKFCYSQTSTEFWFAPPEVTYDHNPPGGVPIYLRVTSGNSPAVVNLSMPANPSFGIKTKNLPANSSDTFNLTAYVEILETKPTNTIKNTGILITSTQPITAYYEVSNVNNCDIFALKGKSALGTEFYIPLHNYPPFYNHTFNTNKAYASFDIVATEDNTTVMIYSKTAVDGYPALTPFSITLNKGQTYSCGWTGANYTNPTTHPSGAVVLSDKPIAITIKDDSNHNPSGGCYDLLGDQIVPVDIVGTDYIVVQGQLNTNPDGDESIFIVPTQNNTKVYINGSNVPIATLFAGQTYRYEIDEPYTYVRTSKPSYVVHVTGFGCEMGIAQLPPLNCAGSEFVSFSRSTSESFYLNIMVKKHAKGSFTIQGGGPGLTIDTNLFNPVPGTNDVWYAGRFGPFSTTQIPVGNAIRLSNSKDVFALGIINGGATSGCRYGYFSEFQSEIIVNAGADQTVCANRNVVLNGIVRGGATQGIWTTSGSGTFVPDNNTLNAEYIFSAADILSGQVKLTLTSNSVCTPVSDEMRVTITPAPIVDAGENLTVCENTTGVQLNGSVSNATGGIWSGGNGTFLPSPTTLNAIYVPTQQEINSGFVKLYLTSVDVNCLPVTDSVIINFNKLAIVNAGDNITVCSNNPNVRLNGSVSGGTTTGVWSTSGSGSFSNNTDLNAIYIPSYADIQLGTVTLTLTSTNNNGCQAVSSSIQLSIQRMPEVNAGNDVFVCYNNPVVTLNGSYSNAGGCIWSGGSGEFVPNNRSPIVTYTLSQSERLAGSVTLTLSTTDNGVCPQVSDNVVITVTPAPIVNAGVDKYVCSNNPVVSISGYVQYAGGGIWSGGGGQFLPDVTSLSISYIPTPAEISAGEVTLVLTSTGNGNCMAVSDEVKIIFTPSPTVFAGNDGVICANKDTINLNATYTVAGGVVWTGGTGQFIPSNTVANPKYIPSYSEKTNGYFDLIVMTTNNGNCNAVRDTIRFIVVSAPIVDAGSNQTVCGNNMNVQLSGTVYNAGGVIWSGKGNFTPNNTSLQVTYTPSIEEKNNGYAVVYITSVNNGLCNAVKDSVIITITPEPSISTLTNLSSCANKPEVMLVTSYSNAGGIIWTGGQGHYNPNPYSTNIVYTPSQDEINSGIANLTVTTTNNGNCLPVFKNVTINISPSPYINGGPDKYVCANNSDVNLVATRIGASGLLWSGGSGQYLPNNTSNTITYKPSLQEIQNGYARLVVTTTGNGNCNAVSDTVMIYIAPSPIVNAGVDQNVCANNATVNLNGFVLYAAGAVWSGGSGTFNPSPYSLNIQYIPSQNEINNGKAILVLTSTGNGNCNAVSDTVVINISPAPVLNVLSQVTSCQNVDFVNLTAGVSSGFGVIWSGGQGIFSPDNTSLNVMYFPTENEKNNGSVSLMVSTTQTNGCLPVFSYINILFNPKPQVNAGIDKYVCSNNNTVQLNGSVQYASGGIWSGGTGLFDPSPTSLNAKYTPSINELINGYTELILTTTGNGNCKEERDTMKIYYTPSPIVEAGENKTVCSNNSIVQLSGSVQIATGGIWSGGSGTFQPSPTSLIGHYYPSSDEINQGFVKLYLTSTGNGNCLPVKDSIMITILKAPEVNAGNDIVQCINNLSVPLNGIVSGITNKGKWTTSGSGYFTPSDSSLTAIYHASQQDSANGVVYIYLTSTNNGVCNAVKDTLVINFMPAGYANAGNDRIVCANNSQVNLNASLTGWATSGYWTTSGSGIFYPTNQILNPTYIPSLSDIASGNVTLTFHANSCNMSSDDITITITPAPVVNAGNDFNVCDNNLNATLSAQINYATGGIWSGGTGTFVYGNTSLNNVYIPSVSEILNGKATLLLTSTGNGLCLPETDTLVITIEQKPYVKAGNNRTVCANNANVQLNGIVSGVTNTGIWSTNGDGTFIPSANVLNPIYKPGNLDIQNGYVWLKLTSTNNKYCLPVSDSLLITILPAPTLNIGEDIITCQNNLSINLSASYTNASGVFWTSLGDGYFNPSPFSKNCNYIPGNNDYNRGIVTIIATTTGNGLCNAVRDTLIVTILEKPYVNAGTDIIACKDANKVTLNGIVSGVTQMGTWSTLGTGYFSDANSLNTEYYFSNSDVISGNVKLILTSTQNGYCLPVRDTLVVTFSDLGNVYAGNSSITVCSNNPNIQLNGSYSGSTTSILWTTTGNGVFVPDPTNPNAVYIPSPYDTALGTIYLKIRGIGSCNSPTDSIKVIFTESPVINTGNDITVCSNNASVQLLASITKASGVLWATLGDGYFTPSSNILNPMYYPGNNDISNGRVKLVATSTGNGICNAVRDTVIITIIHAPVVDAGNNQTVCMGASETQLHGSVSGITTTGIWSTTGSGYFYSYTSLSTRYFFSMEDQINGQVRIILTSTNNNICLPVSDTITITFGNKPYVFAGNDIYTCNTNESVALNGIVTGGIYTGYWSGGSGNFQYGNNVLDNYYYPDSIEKVNGKTILILHSDDNGYCLPTSDTLIINYVKPPQITIGNDFSKCFFDDVVINATANNYTSILWSTSGTGYLSGNDTNSLYRFSTEDLNVGHVYIYATAQGLYNCPEIKDTIKINIIQPAYVNAGNDITVCRNNSIVNLNGESQENIIWLTSGSGNFVPSNTLLNATYIPSVSDMMSDSIFLILKNTTGCGNIRDTIKISFINSPVVNVFSSDEVCSNNSIISLVGIINNAGRGNWSSSGNGEFVLSSDNLINAYIPSYSDIQNGLVKIYLTSIDNGLCNAVTKEKIIYIKQAPSILAEDNMNVCNNVHEINLNVNILNGVDSVIWQTTGNGQIYEQNNTNVFYSIDSTDINSGNIKFVITALTEGCNPVYDTMNVNFISPPIIFAGNDMDICDNINSINITGYISNNYSTVWMTNGTGNFVLPLNSLNNVYNLSENDKQQSEIKLILKSENIICGNLSDTMHIRIHKSPSINLSDYTTVCSNVDSIQITAIADNYEVINWYSSGGGIIKTSDNMSQIIYYPSENEYNNLYTDIYAVAHGNYCPQTSDTIRIYYKPIPSINVNDKTLCNNVNKIELEDVCNNCYWSSLTGGIISMNENGGIEYTLSQSEINQLQAVLMLNIVDEHCGTISDTVRINLKRIPIAFAGEDGQLCPGVNSYNLNGHVENTSNAIWNTSGNGQFSYGSNLGQAIYTPDSSDIQNGYVFLWLTALGDSICPDHSDTLKLILTSPVNPDFNYTKACKGEPVTFSNQSIVNNGTITSVTWFINDQLISSGNEVTYLFNEMGNYTITMNIISSVGCTLQKTKVVNVKALPQPDFTYNTTCFKDSVVLYNNSSVQNDNIDSVYWNFGNSTTYIGNIVKYLFSNSGLYDVEIEVVSSSGCRNKAIKQINIPDVPIVDFNYTYNCRNRTVKFETISGDNLLWWIWNFGDGNISNNNNPVHIYQSGGKYNVQITAGMTENCYNSKNKEINISFAQAAIESYNVCEGQFIQFRDLSTTENTQITSWYWNFGDGITTFVQNPKYNYSNQGNYNVMLIITTSDNCRDTAYSFVSVYPTPEADFVTEKDGIQNLLLPVVFVNKSENANGYIWDFGDSSPLENTDNPIHKYNKDGTYLVTLIAYNNYGCYDTVYKSIVVANDMIVIPPRAPNAFSPNGDGINDVFMIRGGPYIHFDFRVYNEWGKEIFKTHDENKGWDGTYEGVPQPVGIYVWTLEAKTIDGQYYKKHGEISLIK